MRCAAAERLLTKQNWMILDYRNPMHKLGQREDPPPPPPKLRRRIKAADRADVVRMLKILLIFALIATVVMLVLMPSARTPYPEDVGGYAPALR